LASVFHELKQRRIVQIVASYLVSGWVALEVVGAFVERSVLPDIAYSMGLVLYVGGIGISAILGWYHGEKGRQNYTPPELVLLAMVAGLTLFAGYRTWEGHRLDLASDRLAVENAENLNRVAVLYFRDLSRDRDLGYLADGLTESLLDRLAEVQGLDLVSQSGSAQFRDSELPRDSIARFLRAGILVEGTVEPRGEDVRVSLSLVDGAGGAELYRARIEASAADPFLLQDELAEEVLERLRSWLGDEIAVRTARRGTDNVAAWADFQRALRARREADARVEDGDIPGFISEWQRADELLAAAIEADPEWARPQVIRGLLASRWGELSAYESRDEANEYFDLALQRLDAVITAQPRDAFAHQARGMVQYLRWAYGVIADSDDASVALDEARASLERAVDLDDGLANAWNVLSIVNSQKADMVGANMAAREALAADEFLRSAESVLETLYSTSYDLENLLDAKTYCEQGRQRYPASPVFAQCEIWLMGAGIVEPDLDQAWSLLDEYVMLLDEADRPRESIATRILVAQVAAEMAARGNDAALADSALSIVSRSQASAAIDPTRELLGLEALVHLKLNDPATAVERLGVYLTASPSHREGWRWSSHWWWRSLQSDPDFRRLTGR